MTEMKQASKKEMITDIFLRGVRQGGGIVANSMIPNLIMAFVIIKALGVCGLMTVIGKWCGPVMGIWGLPGEALTVLVAAWLAMGGGVGVAVALFSSGTLSAVDIAVLSPAIFLMGAQLQYMGRLLGVVNVAAKMIPIMMVFSILAACVSMWVMRVIV